MSVANFDEMVRIARAVDAEEVGRTLAEGFSDDPVVTWVFQEPGRSAKLSTFFDFLAGAALVPLGATYLVPGSCAAWTPPDTPPWPQERSARFTALLQQECTPADVARLGEVNAAEQMHHPKERCWYLGLIGTTPAAQGRGYGSALLKHSLRTVDGSGLPAYLESTNPRNVPFYQRHGFEATGLIELPDGPSLHDVARGSTCPKTSDNETQSAETRVHRTAVRGSTPDTRTHLATRNLFGDRLPSRIATEGSGGTQNIARQPALVDGQPASFGDGLVELYGRGFCPPRRSRRRRPIRLIEYPPRPYGLFLRSRDPDGLAL